MIRPLSSDGDSGTSRLSFSRLNTLVSLSACSLSTALQRRRERRHHTSFLRFFHDVFTVPQEIFDLDNLSEVLSYKEKHVEKRMPQNVNESRVYDHDGNVTMTFESCSWDADEKPGSSDNQFSSLKKDDKLQKRIYFILPCWYQHYKYRGANQLPRNAKELFNHRHCSMRNAILRSFNVLKTRFSILKLAPRFSFQIQRHIVLAACVLHNFIHREERNDWLFNGFGGTFVDELSDLDELLDVQLLSSIQEHLAFSLRDSIAAAMWDDFLNKWDE